MKPALRRLLIPVTALAALVFAVVLTANWLIDRDAVRAAVQAQIRAATGLDLAIDGDIDIDIIPAATATLHNVTLRGAGGQPAMSVRELVANLRIVPLLRQRFEIADITLIGPRVSVTRSSDGRNNWAGVAETLAQKLKPTAIDIAPFSEIRVVDGAIDYRDASQAGVETIDDIDLSLAWPSISRAVAATGQLTWRGERMEGSVSISDFGAALSGERSVVKSRLASPTFKFAFDGAMTGGLAKADGILNADVTSLRSVIRLLGQTPPATNGFGRFALRARTALNGKVLTLNNANLELDGNTGEGVVQINFVDRPVVLATLATDNLDLTAYSSLVRLLTPGTRDWSKQTFDLADFAACDVDMRLSAAKVNAGAVRFGRTALGASLRNGKFALSIGEAQAFGGSMQGSLGISSSDAIADVKAEFQFIDIDLESAGNDLLGMKRLSGRGNVNISLEASGSSSFALAQTVDGNVRMTAQNGALQGFNVEQLLRRLERRPLSGTGDFRNGRTAFSDLVASWRINQGIAMAEDVRMEGQNTRMTLTGTTSLATREHDLKGVAALVATGNAPPGFELPFVVQGPWDDPLVFPDTESLLRRSPASAPLLDTRKARDAVRSAIERLGGQKPAAADAAPQN